MQVHVSFGSEYEVWDFIMFGTCQARIKYWVIIKQEEECVEDVPRPLHYVFVDLSLENDLKGEELEWFRSRISRSKIKKEKNKHGKDVKEGGQKSKAWIVTSDGLTRHLTDKPGKIILKLTETNTMWLMTLDSLFSQNDVDDAERVRRENETYQMKKTKKELIRKRCMADAQTPEHIEKSIGTLTAEIKMVDSSVFASEWDLYDTYNAFSEEELMSSVKYLVADKLTKTKNPPVEIKEDQVDESMKEEEKKIHESTNFKYATLIAERLLASNCYQDEQFEFKTKFVTRYDEEPTSFAYELKPLWSFQKDMKQTLMVTDLDWNPLNQDLLAVAYGDLNFLRKSSGLVCIWSPKNPRQPERQFLLEESVTCLNYSKLRPNILAVGTRRGKVYVLDVSSHDGDVQRLFSDDAKLRPDPIWKVEWFLHKELIVEKEELLAVGESGVVMLFSFPPNQVATDVLKLDYVSSRQEYLEKKCPGKKTQWQQMENLSYDKKTFSGLYFSIFTNRNFCYVSTKEGVLVKCNLRNPSMMTDVFPAHDGPVYVVEHSPATDLVYFTCGADWNIRIWLEGINKPLITLQNKAPVRCAKWSPTIPTIIASVGDAELSLWDISRNILFPMSTKNFEDCRKPFSTLLFSKNGSNIVVGGEDGQVRLVHLSELPRIPFLQVEALIEAIKNGLYRNKSMIGIVSRMLEDYKEELKTKVEV